MEELKNEQTELLVETAEAEQVENGTDKAEVSLGKFKNTEALLHAYNSLEAEFTKRCQRIKELEAQSALEKAQVSKGEEKGSATENAQGITPEEKTEILKEYLKGIIGAKQQAIIMDGEGNGIKSPLERPTTLEQAGALAREIL